MADVQADPGLVDAAAGDLGAADVMMIFGTAHWTPAEIAVDLYHRGLAPKIIATGGSARQASGLCEAEQHCRLMVAQGIPVDDIFCESRSTNTYENVAMSLPLLEQIGPIETVLAVVKWYHRRALVFLAEQIPSLQRIYAADYEPFNVVTRRGLSRASWSETCPRSVQRETEYLHAMQREGRDLLQPTTAGWVRGPITRGAR